MLRVSSLSMYPYDYNNQMLCAGVDSCNVWRAATQQQQQQQQSVAFWNWTNNSTAAGRTAPYLPTMPASMA
jgi:hypothetical protein